MRLEGLGHESRSIQRTWEAREWPVRPMLLWLQRSTIGVDYDKFASLPPSEKKSAAGVGDDRASILRRTIT